MVFLLSVKNPFREIPIRDLASVFFLSLKRIFSNALLEAIIIEHLKVPPMYS